MTILSIEKAMHEAHLLFKHLMGNLNEQEKEEFENWKTNHERSQSLIELVSNPTKLQQEMQYFSQDELEVRWNKLVQKKEQQQLQRSKIRSWKMVWRSVAAVFMLSLFIAVLKYKQVNSIAKTNGHNSSPFGDEVMSGLKRAILVLSDGNKVVVDQSKDSLFTEAGSKIQLNAAGDLVYTSMEPFPKNVFNSLYIPNAGEYKMQLPDGTKVWLNAGTVFKYPVQFLGKERRVELVEGEAYFEIAKNKEKPFIVVAKQMRVQAIGTAFNIQAYAQADSIISTSLIEGKVSVKLGEENYLVSPGQQLKIKNGVSQLVDADVELITGWKNGLFVFNHTALEEVMNQLSRWYDVEIEYDQNFKKRQYFTGELKRYVPLSTILQRIQLTGIAKFKVIGQKIHIEPYEK